MAVDYSIEIALRRLGLTEESYAISSFMDSWGCLVRRLMPTGG
jgi:hypothetical protein